MTGRIFLGGALAALALASAARPCAAQVTVPRDSVPHRLAPMVITAPAGEGGFLSRTRRGVAARAQIDALTRENRSLTRERTRQDREIARLEARLGHLKTVVTDSLQGEIAHLDSATLATRAQRLRLEERLREREARQAPAATGTP